MGTFEVNGLALSELTGPRFLLRLVVLGPMVCVFGWGEHAERGVGAVRRLSSGAGASESWQP